MQVLLYILEILKRLLGVKMENVITLPFIDQLAKLKKKKEKKKNHLISSIERGLYRFCLNS